VLEIAISSNTRLTKVYHFAIGDYSTVTVQWYRLAPVSQWGTAGGSIVDWELEFLPIAGDIAPFRLRTTQVADGTPNTAFVSLRVLNSIAAGCWIIDYSSATSSYSDTGAVTYWDTKAQLSSLVVKNDVAAYSVSTANHMFLGGSAIRSDAGYYQDYYVAQYGNNAIEDDVNYGRLNVEGRQRGLNWYSLLHFTVGSTSFTVGAIETDGSTTTYHTSSDYRLKDNVTRARDGLSSVQRIPIYTYTFKGSNQIRHGVLAHELQEVLPEAVSGVKDGERHQMVDYSKLTPILVASVQELSDLVNTLATRLQEQNNVITVLNTRLQDVTNRLAVIEQRQP
jgi:hypothetical protein